MGKLVRHLGGGLASARSLTPPESRTSQTSGCPTLKLLAGKLIEIFSGAPPLARHYVSTGTGLEALLRGELGDASSPSRPDT